MLRLQSLLALSLLPVTALADADWVEQSTWEKFFAASGVVGTIAVLDQRGNTERYLTHDIERATRRYLPASTFKVPHALFALDAGVARDEFQIFDWDGEKRWLDAWNRDQNLRSSMRNSVVWVYQRFAREIGPAREREYLERIDYGNADPSGDVDRFWLDGGLRISAVEQIEFLRRLHYNKLPFKVEHQRLVKDLMINAAAHDWSREWVLRAKTGWATHTEPDIGWWVGWIEWPDGPVFFALNIDMPQGRADASKRKHVAREVLRSIGALPD